MTIHLIITCVAQKTTSKTISILDDAIKSGEVKFVFEQWKKTLLNSNLTPVIARKLYKGMLWNKYMDLWGLLQGRLESSKLWIISAGHGLINGDDLVVPYNITFQDSHFDIPSLFAKVKIDDSAESKRDISRRWWSMLTEYNTGKEHNSISSLICNSSNEDKFIIVAGKDYIDAVFNDLKEGLNKIKQRENLIIISNNVNDSLLKTLKPNWLYSNSKFVNLKGTNSTTLNASIAKELFWYFLSKNEGIKCWSINEFNSFLQNLAANLSDINNYEREKNSDDVIKDFIASELSKKVMPFSKLHRIYRDSGKACEYKRFRELYKQVKSSIEEETARLRRHSLVNYSKRNAKMLFFLPDWDDRVDPDFDFENEISPPFRNPYLHDKYHYELYGHLNCDGILVSKSVLEDNRTKKKLAKSLGIHKYLRLPVNVPVMGDCGAFNYVMDFLPPYKTSEILNYYEDLGFDYGVSIDHLIVPAVYSGYNYYKREGADWLEINKDDYASLKGQEGVREVRNRNSIRQLGFFDEELLICQEKYVKDDEKNRRYDLTLENAVKFIKGHNKASYHFTPIGAAQGWDPASYAYMVREFEKMGYNYIALGGLVKSKTEEILNVLHEINKTKKANTKLHVFGVARPDAIESFLKEGVSSVDNAGVLRQAWLSSTDNYYTPDFDNYSAIRIPQATDNLIRELQERMALENKYISFGKVITLEVESLLALRAYDRGELDLKKTLHKVIEYNKLIGVPPKITAYYERTLADKPWKSCKCKICQETGIDVIIFRGNNRNRRRGFHNTWVYYNWFRPLTGDAK